MTNCIVLGEDNQEKKKLKPIEFVWADSGGINGGREKAMNKPSHFNNVELVSRSTNEDLYFDIMFAYNYKRSEGVTYFGWWNDGVSE